MHWCIGGLNAIISVGQKLQFKVADKIDGGC